MLLTLGLVASEVGGTHCAVVAVLAGMPNVYTTCTLCNVLELPAHAATVWAENSSHR